MSPNTYQVIFRGELVPGANAADVRVKLQQLFKASDQVMDKLMSGKPLVIKKGITQDKAEAFQRAMESAGAIAKINLMEVEEDIVLTAVPADTASNPDMSGNENEIKDDRLPPPPSVFTSADTQADDIDDLPPPPPAEITENSDPSGIAPVENWETEPVGTRLSKPKSGFVPDVPDTQHLNLSPPNSDIEQLKHKVKPVRPNISHLEMAMEGSPLSTHKKKETVTVPDLSHIELAQVGEDLGQSLEAKEMVTPDISALSLAELSGDIPTLKHDKEEVDPDTSHLTLEPDA